MLVYFVVRFEVYSSIFVKIVYSGVGLRIENELMVVIVFVVEIRFVWKNCLVSYCMRKVIGVMVIRLFVIVVVLEWIMVIVLLIKWFSFFW